MIKLLRKLATAMLPALLCGTLFIGCEADDKYTKVDDLFQPRFVLEKPEVKANSVTLVWYKVNDAASYTVQLHQDQYYTSLFMEMETTDPYVFMYAVMLPKLSITRSGVMPVPLLKLVRNMPNWWKMFPKPRLRNHRLSFAGKKTINIIRWIV